MSQESKYTLLAQNQSSFPNNTTGYITPEILREFNIDMIDSLVDEISFSAYSASNAAVIRNFSSSVDTRLDSLELFSSSLDATYATDAQLAAVSSALNTSKVGNSQTSSMAVSSSTYAVTASYSLTASFAINAAGVNTGSLVTTSSFNTLTQSFNQYTSSTDTKIAALNTISASYLTFTQSYYTESSSFSQRIDAVNDNLVTTSSFNSFTSSYYVDSASFDSRINNFVAGVGFVTTASFNAYTQSISSSINTLSSSIYLTDVTQSNNITSNSASIFTNTINIATLTSKTGSYATTGSNTFKGTQTLSDADLLNQIGLGTYSGSLVLFGKGFTSSSMTHITASSTAVDNIVFKTTNAGATTYISGSNNIFTDSETPTAGFKRILGKSNVNLYLALPQVSASMGDYVYIDNNFLTARNTSPITIRGPISSSAWEIKGNVLTQQLNIGTSAANHAQGLVSGLLLNNCYIGATLGIVANKANLTQQPSVTNSNLAGAVTLNMNSSSIDYINNITAGGTTTINNNTTGSSRVSINATNTAFLSSNIFAGNTTITLSGSNDPNDVSDIDYNGGLVRNIIVGSGINARVNTGLTGSNTLAGTAIIGNGLTITGSSQNPLTNGGTNLGSTFLGRYNATDGNRAKSAETVLAVGTGTSTSARKTGFLIDSGSNTFIEGTLNISGSGNTTGSFDVSGSFTSSLETGKFYVGNLSGRTEAVATGSFVSNTADIYTSSAAVQQIVTLTQSEWNSISGSSNSNTLYIIM